MGKDINAYDIVLLVLFFGGLAALLLYAFSHEGMASHNDQEGPKQ